MLETERAYVHSLRILVKAYRPALQRVLGDEDVEIIFGSSEAIFSANASLLQRLEQAEARRLFPRRLFPRRLDGHTSDI